MFDAFAYRMIRAFSVILGTVPTGVASLLGSALGRIWFVMDRRHRDVAIRNLTTAFGDAMSMPAIRSLARKNFISFASILFEIGWLVRVKRKDARRLFKFYGLGNLIEARKKGRGVLVLTAHFGNWEILIMAADMLGAPMSAVYRPLDFAPLDRFFVNLRRRFGARMYPKKRAVMGVMRSLKNNELVGVLLDQNTNLAGGVFVDFFGKPACTNKGLAVLARATGAPVISAFLAREDGLFHVEFGPEIPTIKTENENSDIYANTRNYNRALESIIRKHPEQWFWVHNRWKTRPTVQWRKR
ncbi:MAG: lysophospholipid acyltransferase family protein [Deltaproteobacteria bacterium]|nr:lysophospholipid acyltransferase family protein [Deltaproteobacteria bacterium]